PDRVVPAHRLRRRRRGRGHQGGAPARLPRRAPGVRSMSMLRGKWSMRPLGLLSVGLLGASTALLVACGSSGKLIPVANSEPLQKDFEEVARAAENGHGGCSSTEAALNKADHDFAGLPASVDAGLRRRLG